MKRNKLWLAIIACCFMVSSILPSCTKEENEPIVREYVGSDKCKECHTEIHEAFVESGHPYKITKVNGAQPTIPFVTGIQTPDGYTWNDLTYMIGGYGWKARFINSDGYTITQVAGSQWNVLDGSRSVYNGSVPNGTETYSCGQCHTTGWKSLAEGGKKQDGLIGMGGQFFAGGIQCEACHGGGSRHIESESPDDIALTASTTLCAQCHQRRRLNGDTKQQTSGGWEMHRNQVEQIMTNSHYPNVGCNTCHDVHASTRKDNVAKGNGVKKDCQSCHTAAKYSNTHYTATCVQCHMPHTVKNGTSVHKYYGDAPNHNFKINTDSTATYLTTDATGTWANLNKKGSTLDFVCYQCHTDANGIGGTKSTKTMGQLSVKAVTFHK